MKLIFIFLTLGVSVLGVRQSSSECGIRLPQEKIVGGVDSGGYHYPWFALLLLKKNAYLPVPICAGSLITSFHVLTAAHCLTISATIQYKDLFSVALGVYNICNDAEATRQIFNVEDVAIHENYRRKGKFYDIALLKLDRPAEYTFICLPFLGVPDVTEVAVLIGFGVTEENSNFVPCHMLEVNVTKYSKKDCSSTKLPPEDSNEGSVICAGALTGEVDSCYGDSGGPLQTISSDGRYTIAGIVSYGYGCGTPNVPGIYTNVGSYIQWINSKISSLGPKETNITKDQNSTVSTDTKRNTSRRRIHSSVFSRRTTTLKPQNGKSPTQQNYPDPRRYKFNNSYFYIDKQSGENHPSSTPKKNSNVVFPD